MLAPPNTHLGMSMLQSMRRTVPMAPAPLLPLLLLPLPLPRSSEHMCAMSGCSRSKQLRRRKDVKGGGEEDHSNILCLVCWGPGQDRKKRLILRFFILLHVPTTNTSIPSTRSR